MFVTLSIKKKTTERRWMKPFKHVTSNINASLYGCMDVY